VTVPAGVKNGRPPAAQGQGNLQPGTGRRGISQPQSAAPKDHPIWKLDGGPVLRAELPLALMEARPSAAQACAVATPDGARPPSRSSGKGALGRSLRLKGQKGWPSKTARGDLPAQPSLEAAGTSFSEASATCSHQRAQAAALTPTG